MDGASVKVAVPEHGGLLALDTEGAVFASVRVAFLTKNEQLQNERVQIVELLQPRFFLRDNEEEIEDDQLLSHLSHDHITEEYVDHAMVSSINVFVLVSADTRADLEVRWQRFKDLHDWRNQREELSRRWETCFGREHKIRCAVLLIWVVLSVVIHYTFDTSESRDINRICGSYDPNDSYIHEPRATSEFALFQLRWTIAVMVVWHFAGAFRCLVCLHIEQAKYKPCGEQEDEEQYELNRRTDVWATLRMATFSNYLWLFSCHFAWGVPGLLWYIPSSIITEAARCPPLLGSSVWIWRLCSASLAWTVTVGAAVAWLTSIARDFSLYDVHRGCCRKIHTWDNLPDGPLVLRVFFPAMYRVADSTASITANSPGCLVCWFFFNGPKILQLPPHPPYPDARGALDSARDQCQRCVTGPSDTQPGTMGALAAMLPVVTLAEASNHGDVGNSRGQSGGSCGDAGGGSLPVRIMTAEHGRLHVTLQPPSNGRIAVPVCRRLLV
jgi:hypothetical protein